MAIHYRVDVLQWLKAAGYNTGRLRREKLLGQSTLTKLRRGELLSWGETGRVCEMLHCQPGDLFVYFPETAEGAKVPGLSEFTRGVELIAAAVGASGETITACATRAHMSAITIAEAVNMTDSQLVVMGDYLLEFADGAEARGHKAEARAAGDGAEAEAQAEVDAQGPVVPHFVHDLSDILWYNSSDKNYTAWRYLYQDMEYAATLEDDYKAIMREPWESKKVKVGKLAAIKALEAKIIAHMEAGGRSETGSEAGAGDLSPGDGGAV
ncbi:MAG: helix-turn-helix transcriptional regulator [Akkermansia sp.]|nr:helix-turn-helix transcriptional regulator [Akkermansia sp.]